MRTNKHKRKQAGLKPMTLPRGLFTAKEAIEGGLSRASFYRLVASGKITSVDRGLYVKSTDEIPPEILALAIACKRFGPDSLIGGLTALFRYGLIEQVPTKIWVMTPPSVKGRDSRYRIIRTKINPQVGVVKSKHFRMADINRAIVEALRFSTKIGLRTAIEAARSAIRSEKTSESAILRRAKEMGLEKFVLQYWEAITAN